ncbi:MAG TPA: IclR family transcriptional regulator [Solirubrobacteraceae bacterium]
MKRGTAILIALGGEEAVDGEGLGVVRIAQLVGYEKSQVSRALAALAESGLVDRDPVTRAYRLGWRFFALAARSGRPRLMQLAPTVLGQLVADLGETAHLSVLQGTDVLTLLSEAPSSAIKAHGWSGRTVPASCTSSGRALLFDHDVPALEALFGASTLERRRPRGPATVAQLHRRIRSARARGYAVVDEEFEAGLVGTAAPVRDFSGRIIAAINVSGPKFRLGKRLPLAGAAVRRGAGWLSEEMVSAPGASGASAGLSADRPHP